MKKELQKNLSFVLFVMAVFFAGMSLTVFQSYIWMSCIAGVMLLATAVFYVLSKEKDDASPAEKTTEILLADRMAELMRGNEKAEKGVYIAVKKQHEAMESGLAALEEKLGELIKAQENSVKTLVMYNKENAKQIALSEREELGHLREEIRGLQKGSGSGTTGSMSAVVDAIREMSHKLYEEVHENSEAMLSELETTVDCLEEMRDSVKLLSASGARSVVEKVSVSEPMMMPAVEEEPESEPEEEPIDMFAASEEDMSDSDGMLTADDIAALFAQADDVATEPEPEEEPVDMFAASGVDLSDPNRPLSADDIAALFAQADVAAEPVMIPEEEPAEEKPEDALASSGVDLSDPNRTLSADDIAALVASLGN